MDLFKEQKMHPVKGYLYRRITRAFVAAYPSSKKNSYSIKNITFAKNIF